MDVLGYFLCAYNTFSLFIGKQNKKYNKKDLLLK